MWCESKNYYYGPKIIEDENDFLYENKGVKITKNWGSKSESYTTGDQKDGAWVKKGDQYR